MSIQLTAQQQQVLDSRGSGLPRFVDPRTDTTYILVLESEYESVRVLLEEERCQKEIRATALRNAAGRMDEAP